MSYLGEGTPEAMHLQTSGTLSYVFLPTTDFNPCASLVINDCGEYNNSH